MFFRKKNIEENVINKTQEIFIDEGVVEDRSDEHASKEIKSDKLNYFYMELHNTRGRYSFLELTCTPDADKIYCNSTVTPMGSKDFREDFFEASRSIFQDLCSVCTKYNLALINGHNLLMHGASQEQFTSLIVKFESGEMISVYDNNSCLLSEECVEELLQIFKL